MARRKHFVEVTPGRFVSGTFARIDAVLRPGEDRSAFLREAVDREIERRERRAERPRPSSDSDDKQS